MPERGSVFDRLFKWIKQEYSFPKELLEPLQSAITLIERGLSVRDEKFKNRSCLDTQTELSFFTSKTLK